SAVAVAPERARASGSASSDRSAANTPSSPSRPRKTAGAGTLSVTGVPSFTRQRARHSGITRLPGRSRISPRRGGSSRGPRSRGTPLYGSRGSVISAVPYGRVDVDGALEERVQDHDGLGARDPVDREDPAEHVLQARGAGGPDLHQQRRRTRDDV